MARTEGTDVASRKTPNTVLRLRLYIAGNAPNSLRALANVRSLCQEHFRGQHELEIVDLLTHPLKALADDVIVTPTLLKLAPPPSQRVIGNLSDLAGVLAVLSAR